MLDLPVIETSFIVKEEKICARRGEQMLIAMAGLPGAGKSTIAARLTEELGAVVLNKDTVRAALFPLPVLDYSAEQDDISMDAIYHAAASILKASSRRTVILDGRTFLRAKQVDDLLRLAAAVGESTRIIECVCDDTVAKLRLEKDQSQGGHPAANRTFALYQQLKESAQPMTLPRLVLDTGRLSVENCVQQALDYLQRA
jgi:adenylylsulfate kinase